MSRTSVRRRLCADIWRVRATCNFTLERKLERFLQLTLRIYCVPEEKQREVMALIANLDIRAIANEVMQKLICRA